MPSAMSALRVILIWSRPVIANFCRHSPELVLVRELSATELPTAQPDSWFQTRQPPELVLVDANLELPYRASSLRRRLEDGFNLPMIVLQSAHDRSHAGSDCLRLTVPPGPRLWRQLLQTATLTRKLYKIIAMMRHTVERPGDFLFSEVSVDKLDQSIFDEQYRSAQRRFQLMAATVQQTKEGILLIRPDHTIEYLNSAAETLLHNTKSEIVGKSVEQLKNVRLGRNLAEIVARLAVSGGVWQSDVEIEDTIFELHLTAIHDKEAKIVGYAAIINDITAKEALERRFAEVEKMEALGNLAGGIAHDFNNILLALQANLDAIKMLATPPPELKKFFDRANNACDRAGQLIKHFLNFSRCVKEPEQPVSLRQTIREVIALLGPSLPKTITLKTALDKQVGDIMANPIQVYEVVMNLVKNAVDAIRDGAGQITVTLEEELLSPGNRLGLPPGNYVRLAVTDTGSGMPEEIAAHIFEPFFTTKKISHGTGLGLSVVHGIVSSLNGHIGVKSSPGQGSEFYIYLPLQTSPPSSTVPDTGCPGHILLVGRNSAEEPAPIAKLLREVRCRVTVAPNAIAALALLAQGPEEYHLLIGDQVWRTANGDNLFEKAFEIKDPLPAIFITDHSETTDFSYPVLNKIVMLMRPYAPTVLQQAVLTLLAGRR